MKWILKFFINKKRGVRAGALRTFNPQILGFMDLLTIQKSATYRFIGSNSSPLHHQMLYQLNFAL